MSKNMSKVGWRNHYRAGMPTMEWIIKDLRSAFRDLSNLFKNGRLPVVITYPDYPSKRTTVQAITKKLGYRLTNKVLPNSDLVIFFDDQTHKRPLDPVVSACATRVWNAQCTDISKQKVERIHLDVFGYGTFIDPVSYSGIAVQKSDSNAMHDGTYVTCPIDSPVSNCVYQRVLDNQTENGLALDYRVPFIDGTLPLVYYKFKDWSVRFTNEVVNSKLMPTNEVFSDQEKASICAFAEHMQVDFCEFDVIRDRTDGKIYIIDVNTTPYGPPAKLTVEERKKAIATLAMTFQKAVFG
jgi:hypothetical protein